VEFQNICNEMVAQFFRGATLYSSRVCLCVIAYNSYTYSLRIILTIGRPVGCMYAYTLHILLLLNINRYVLCTNKK